MAKQNCKPYTSASITKAFRKFSDDVDSWGFILDSDLAILAKEAPVYLNAIKARYPHAEIRMRAGSGGFPFYAVLETVTKSLTAKNKTPDTKTLFTLGVHYGELLIQMNSSKGLIINYADVNDLNPSYGIIESHKSVPSVRLFKSSNEIMNMLTQTLASPPKIIKTTPTENAPSFLEIMTQQQTEANEKTKGKNQ